MKKRIPMKTLYLIALITVGLISLGVGSTYAMFKAEIIIDEPIYLTSNLSYASDIMETVDVTVSPGETKHVILNITNNHNSDLAYIVWYINEGLNIDFGTEIGENSYGCTTMCSGVPVGSDPIEVGIYIRNNESTSVNITIGISGSVGNVVLSNNMVMIPNQELPTAYTAISNFEYSIGTYDVLGDGTKIINLPENTVLLTDYIGTEAIVNVGSTYKIDGVVYTPIVYGDSANAKATFMYNNVIEEVNFSSGVLLANFNNGNTLTLNSMANMFQGCESLTKVTGIPNNIVNMSYTFYGCTSLVNAPVIPNTVTNLGNTFYGCTSLTSVSNIPNSVIYMNSTFYGCSSLTSVPNISTSVTNMNSTFNRCTSLTSVPTIPNTVTTMHSTFFGCTNLTGDVVIESPNVTIINYIFYGTSKTINVYVPADSTTFTKLSECAANAGKPATVNLYTLNN